MMTPAMRPAGVDAWAAVVLSRSMNFLLLVVVVAVVSVAGTIAWTVRDDASWQTTACGIAAVAFILLSLAVWVYAVLTAGFSCEPCDIDAQAPPGLEWTQNAEASEWALIAYLGSSVMALALVGVATLHFRRHRAALLFLGAYVAASVQLALMLDDAGFGGEVWSWILWPTAAGAVMLLAARDRDGLPVLPRGRAD
jgi:hypothetical protein